MRSLAPWQESQGLSPPKYFVPRPLHSGHAPYGELKEKSLGSTSGKEKPSFLQANRAENKNSFCSPRSPVPSSALVPGFIKETETKPSDSISARSKASESLALPASWFMVNSCRAKRSTNMSILCALFLERVMDSRSFFIAPSRRISEKPLLKRSYKY